MGGSLAPSAAGKEGKEAGGADSTSAPSKLPSIDDARLWGLFRCSAGDRYELLTPGSQLKDKVLLYVHGWQPGHNVAAFDPDSKNLREHPAITEGFLTPDREAYGERYDTAAPWREAGYDVVCFFWAPIADEATPKEAERKVWDEQDGKEEVHLQWKCPGCQGCSKSRCDKQTLLPENVGSCNSGYRSEGMPHGSLGQAFCKAWEELVTAQGAKRPNYLHLVGHSLGSQLSCNFLRQQIQVRGDSTQVIQRFTLLDPYFTNFKKAHLDGRWPGQVVREVVRAVSSTGAAVEQYRSSKVLDNPLSDSNKELRKMVAYFVMQPGYLPVQYGVKDFAVLAHRHSAAKYVYFRSKANGPAEEVAYKSPVGPWEPIEGSSGAGYAGASDDRIRELMAADYYWQQALGTDSPDPALHGYEKISKAALGQW